MAGEIGITLQVPIIEGPAGKSNQFRQFDDMIIRYSIRFALHNCARDWSALAAMRCAQRGRREEWKTILVNLFCEPFIKRNDRNIWEKLHEIIASLLG